MATGSYNVLPSAISTAAWLIMFLIRFSRYDALKRDIWKAVVNIKSEILNINMCLQKQTPLNVTFKTPQGAVTPTLGATDFKYVLLCRAAVTSGSLWLTFSMKSV